MKIFRVKQESKMNKLFKIVTICFIIGFSFTVPLLSEENKPIVSVIPFDYSEDVERDSSVTLTQLLKNLFMIFLLES